MQTVWRIGTVVLQNHLMLVRPVNILRTKTNLPTFRTSGRTGDIVHSVYLIHVRTFHPGFLPGTPAVIHTFVPDLDRFPFDGSHIGIQLRDIQFMLSVHDINLSVVIKQQSRIIEIFRKDRPFPRSLRLLRFTNGEMPFFRSPTIRCTKSNIEFPVMVPDGTRPRAIQIKIPAFQIITGIIIIPVYRISDHLPVHQIFRFGYRATGYIVHTGRDEVEIVPYPYHIRIGPIAPHDRIGKRPVAIIRRPYLLCLHRKSTHSEKATC